MDILKIKKSIPSLTPLVIKTLQAQAVAEVLREKVDAIKLEVLRENIFLDVLSRSGKGERILEVNKDYHMSEESFAIYLEEVRKKEDEQGLRNGLEIEKCPALVAENIVRILKREIVEKFASLVGDESFVDNLYTSRNFLQNYNNFFELIFKLVLNQPSNKNTIDNATKVK